MYLYLFCPEKCQHLYNIFACEIIAVAENKSQRLPANGRVIAWIEFMSLEWHLLLSHSFTCFSLVKVTTANSFFIRIYLAVSRAIVCILWDIKAWSNNNKILIVAHEFDTKFLKGWKQFCGYFFSITIFFIYFSSWWFLFEWNVWIVALGYWLRDSTMNTISSCRVWRI